MQTGYDPITAEQETWLNGAVYVTDERLNAGMSRLAKVGMMLLLPLLAAAIAACDSGSPSPTATPTGAVPVIGSPTVVGTPVNSRAPYEGVPEGKPQFATTNLPNVVEAFETLPVGQLPSYALNLQSSDRDKVIAEYAGAVEHYDAYSRMPCYCGCGMYEQPHDSLARCFITEKSDANVVFTDHGTTCDKCQDVASMTLDGLAANRPLDIVRAEVFKKYKYTGTWTDTPAP